MSTELSRKEGTVPHTPDMLWDGCMIRVTVADYSNCRWVMQMVALNVVLSLLSRGEIAHM